MWGPTKAEWKGMIIFVALIFAVGGWAAIEFVLWVLRHLHWG